MKPSDIDHHIREREKLCVKALAGIPNEQIERDAKLYAHVGEIRSAAEKLANRTKDYRMVHDALGGGSRESGRAWDLMRRAENELFALLAKLEESQ